jgi:hypothetical protein
MVVKAPALGVFLVAIAMIGNCIDGQGSRAGAEEPSAQMPIAVFQAARHPTTVDRGGIQIYDGIAGGRSSRSTIKRWRPSATLCSALSVGR